MSGPESNAGEPKVVRAQAQAALGALTAMAIKVRTRSYLSTQHLYAARYAADAAETLEAEYAGERPAFNLRHRGLVLSAVAEAVMFLEGAINEVFQDAVDGHHGYVGPLGEAPLKLMAAFWEATDNGRTKVLIKYKQALKFCGQAPFDEGTSPYQDVKLLIELRNYLVHYRPEDVGDGLQPKMCGGLLGRFPNNALMAGSGNPWFPSHALGAGCAVWAWKSARAFADKFAGTIGLSLNYQVADFGDPLPK